MTDSNDLLQARALFLNILMKRVREGCATSIISMLQHGPAGQAPHEYQSALSDWFQQLDSNSQFYVQQVIKEAIDSALFGVLVILDGMTGGYPVEGVVSDFALYLQTYVDAHAEEADLPIKRIRLNPVGPTEDLHDSIQWTHQKQGDEPS